MDMMMQPPASARPGTVLSPPVTVRVRVPRDGVSDEEDLSELGQLFAVAALIKTDANGNAASRPAVLTGQRFADSVRPFSNDRVNGHVQESAGSRPLGYVSFPNLVIRQEGTYRIRIALIRMGNPGLSLASQGASNMETIDSEPITVWRDAHDVPTSRREVSEGE
ncbi:hypothetical protein LTR39_005774 [Cryomyces antarcticus]|nr:hypothetical protein LTR39_005774 [Cryomyces antarcticus]